MKKMFGLALLALSSVGFAGSVDEEEQKKLKASFVSCGAECEEIEEEEEEEIQ